MKNPIKAVLTSVAAASLVFTAMPTAQAKSPVLQATAKKAAINSSNHFENNTLVVQYRSPFTYDEIRNLNGSIKRQINELNTVVLKFKNEESFKNAATKLAQSNKVEKLSLSPKYTFFGSVDDKDYFQYTHSSLHTKSAYKVSNKKNVKVAVIDSGVDFNHPELKGKVTTSINVADPMKKSVAMSHGTHVAGIIAAKMNNQIGGYGVYPNASILSYDVFNGEEYANAYDVANAIIKATKSGAKIINMSIGGFEESPVLESAINYAHAKGVTIFAASGNEDTDSPSLPASYEHVISVGSTNENQKRSEFSNYGPSLDIMAPGENIYSTSYNNERGSTFEFMSGTSMASPNAAGYAAMLVSKHKKINPDQIEYILKQTAKDRGAKGYDLKYGYGLIQPLKAVKYDYKKIPSLTSKKWTNASILKDAKVVPGSTIITSKLTKPNEKSWRKVKVKKGQYVQAKLDSGKNKDLKLSFKSFGKKPITTAINDVASGKTEAGYVKAKEDGYIAIGVNDVFGQVNSDYTLQVLTLDAAPKDEATSEKPMEVTSNKTVKNLYMSPTTSGVDTDTFHFKATKDELLQVNTSKLPGVNLGIEIYKKEDLYGDGDHGPLVSINKNGIGEAEYASFVSKAGQDYYVVVSNASNSANLPTDDLMNQLQLGMAKPKASMLPYSLTLSGKDVPKDEDPIIYSNDDGSAVHVDKPNAGYSLEKLFTKYGRDFDFKKGMSGYLQGSNDIDGYYFKTTTDGFYEFSTVVAHDVEQPSVTIYEVSTDPKTGVKSEQFYASNSTEDGVMKPKAIASLKAKTTYLVEVGIGSNGSIPQKGYKIIGKKLKSNVADAYEMNDEPNKAKNITAGKTVKGNFSKPNDVDFYYFTAPSNGLYQLKMEGSYFDDALYSDQWHNYYTKAVSFYKDTNGNRKLDAKEMSTVKPLPEDLTGEAVTGSIEAKKGEKFFIVTQANAFTTKDTFSIYPYELQLKKAATKDEDAKNKVKNNKPSHPIKFKKYASDEYAKKGYMNPGYMNGDTDWYSFNSKVKHNVAISVEGPEEMDPVIEIYAKGKLVKKFDYYGKGDSEIGDLVFNKKTQYYIKVRDRQGSSFVDPYEISLALY